MKWEAFTEAMVLRYGLPPMPGRIKSAQNLLAAFFKRAHRPYIAFSTGKDSLVALDLALRLRPDVAVVWHDEHWVLPGTLETLAAVEAHYNIRILRVRERLADDEFYAEYGIYPVCPNPRPVDFEADHWQEIVQHFGFDGAVIALRAQESARRKFALRRPLRWHLGSEEWRVSPVHNWSVYDIWTYIIANKLPYHPAYEQQVRIGVEIERARIGPLTAVRVYQYGGLETVKRLYPDLWNAFVSANPCVR